MVESCASVMDAVFSNARVEPRRKITCSIVSFGCSSSGGGCSRTPPPAGPQGGTTEERGLAIVLLAEEFQDLERLAGGAVEGGLEEAAFDVPGGIGGDFQELLDRMRSAGAVIEVSIR